MIIPSRLDAKGNTVPALQFDDRFAEEVLQHTWHIDRGGYVKRNCAAGPAYMHGLVWELAGRESIPIIDHINRDKTDNRLCNLRQATALLNAKNSRQPPAPSGLPAGVRRRGSGFWSEISHRRHQKRIGNFDTIEEASEAYENAREILIEFAALDGYKKVIERLPEAIKNLQTKGGG